MKPHAIVIAGPNGAGKSTAAPALLRDLLGVAEYVNADLIAQGLSAFDTASVAFQAGRVMLTRLKQLAAQRRNFAFETTRATRSYLPLLARLQSGGYVVAIIFLWLPTPEVAVARVAERVRLGGHDVPEPVIHRRYHRGLENFCRRYRAAAGRWWLIDNSDTENRKLIASGGKDRVHDITDHKKWSELMEQFQ